MSPSFGHDLNQNLKANKKVDYDATNDFSKCYIPWNNVTGLIPVVVIKGTTATGQSVTELSIN